jgi:hypothetical protein
MRALFCPLTGFVRGGGSALPAELVGSVPVHNLEGAACDSKKLLSQIPEDTSQTLEGHVLRSGCSRTALCRVAWLSIQEPEVLFANRRQVKRCQIHSKGNPEPRFCHLNEEFVTEANQYPG